MTDYYYNYNYIMLWTTQVILTNVRAKCDQKNQVMCCEY